MSLTVPVAELSNYIDQRRVSEHWLRVDQQRINDFADVTGDHQFIHVDPEKAAQTPLGGTIAHGLLTLALLPKLVEPVMIVPENAAMGINYGFDRVRFPQPVPSGGEIRARMTLKAVDERQPGEYLLRSRIAVDIRGEAKPALIAESLALFVLDAS